MGIRRLLVATVAAAGAVVFVGTASGSFAPKISASTNAAGLTRLTYSQSPSDATPASLTFYVPTGYITTTGQPENEAFGTVTATISAGDLGGATVKAAGTLVGVLTTTPITVSGIATTVGDAATACTGRSTHDGYWIAQVSASGQTLQVPLYLDLVFGAANPLAAFSSFAVTACLPPSDVPAGTPGRATLGAKLTSLSMDINNVWSLGPGWYIWRLQAIPYAASTGKVDLASTVEAQAQDRYDQVLTATARRVGKKTTVSGRLLAGGRGVGSATVKIWSGKSAVGSVKTRPDGRYSAGLKLAPSVRKISATTDVAPRDGGACQSPGVFRGAPCTALQVFGFSASSATTKVR